MKHFIWLLALLFSSQVYATNLCLVFLEPNHPYEVITTEVDHDTYGEHHITWFQTFENDSFDFSATLDPLGRMSFSAYLVNHETRTRSSMSGAKLLKKSIRFFKHKNINAITANWNQDSDNFIQFHQALADGYSKEEAAFMTWTGRNAYANGFTKLILVEEKVVYDKTGMVAVVAIFEKEKFKFPFFK